MNLNEFVMVWDGSGAIRELREMGEGGKVSYVTLLYIFIMLCLSAKFYFIGSTYMRLYSTGTIHKSSRRTHK